MPRHRSKRVPFRDSKTSANAKVAPAKIATQKTADVTPKTSVQEAATSSICETTSVEKISSLLDDNHITEEAITSGTANLYDELDSFRLKWKRELEGAISGDAGQSSRDVKSSRGTKGTLVSPEIDSSINTIEGQENRDPNKVDSISQKGDHPDHRSQEQTYAKAKKLFLQAVELERDDMHHESIKYYKQAMHLCPNIERQIYREQSEASTKDVERQKVASLVDRTDETFELNPVPLYDRIQQAYCDDNNDDRLIYCKPNGKLRPGALHFSDLPHELIMLIVYHVVGRELDLASLEKFGLVCRGFYLLSRDSSLWRSICHVNWGDKTCNYKSPSLTNSESKSATYSDVARFDWRRMYIERPRVNFDGIYISRTRYIRQGETGFQDLTYRPFHVIRYYRYIRFFPDKRVIILTTNEEPDKIIPIFRHAQNVTQFSPELSTLEGIYEFVNGNQIHIVAEKDCRPTKVSLSLRSQRRQSQQYNNWSRQTPLSQKFNMKFELTTVENKPFRNNILRWQDYTILSRLEYSQEITNFDISSDTFPSLQFHRVRICNMKSTKPLAQN